MEIVIAKRTSVARPSASVKFASFEVAPGALPQRILHGDAADDDAAPVEGWLLRVVGKGEKLREVPVPQAVVIELQDYLESRGLAREIADLGNQGAFLLGQASDAATRAPGLDRGGVFDPRPGIAASTLYRQLKGFFGDCAQVLARQGDTRGSQRLA